MGFHEAQNLLLAGAVVSVGMIMHGVYGMWRAWKKYR